MNVLQPYINRLAEILQWGDAREESCYPSLEKLIKTLAAKQKRSNIDVTTLPKPTEAGNPGFVFGTVITKLPQER